MPVLHDGRQVPDDSFDWLLECLALWVLDLKPKERRTAWLDGFAEKQPRVAPVLRERILAVHAARKEHGPKLGRA